MADCQLARILCSCYMGEGRGLTGISPGDLAQALSQHRGSYTGSSNRDLAKRSFRNTVERGLAAIFSPDLVHVTGSHVGLGGASWKKTSPLNLELKDFNGTCVTLVIRPPNRALTEIFGSSLAGSQSSPRAYQIGEFLTCLPTAWGCRDFAEESTSRKSQIEGQWSAF